MANAESGGSLFARLQTRFRDYQFRLSQGVLFSWIRPTILGADTALLNITPDDLVCYVMPFQSTSDLLVLDRACSDNQLPRPINAMPDLEARSFFFLGHPEGRFGRKTQREQSARMLRLFDHQLSLNKPIKIVPVSFFWGHQPDKEKSLIKILLSENWTVTSRFKKLLSGFIHSNHILVQFGQPVDLSALMAEESNRDRQVRRLLRILRTHFTNQKQAIIGPDLSHRRTLINAILDSADVKAAMEGEVQAGQNPGKVNRRALAYANEIASDQSYRVIRFFHIILSWLWNTLYDGIDIYGVETAKTLAQSFEVIYVPCHRSHIDYLLLSYVLYHNGLTPPHIAAGKNLNLPVVGPLLRRGGAFFMRRSFKDDELYKAVFDEYLHLMFTRGYSVEYFIEGGRSRTGRTLNPRTGMLSMTVRSFQRDSSKPIVFLPVYFGYERILELQTYLGELQGQEKKQESILDLFRVMRSLSKPFGRVAVNFGEPLELDAFISNHSPDWRETPLLPNDFAVLCKSLSYALASRINGAVTVKSINLVATAILATPRQTIRRDRLIRQVEILQQIAIRAPISAQLIVTTESPEDILETTTRVVKLKEVHQSVGDIYRADANLAILLTYYRNNTCHVFALASFIARIVRMRAITTESEILDYCLVLQPYLEAEHFASWQDNLASMVQQTCHALQSLHLVRETPTGLTPPPGSSGDFASLTELAEIIEPTLERFYIVAMLLDANQQQTTSTLEVSASEIAEQLSAIFGINAPEFFDKSLFRLFINTLDREQCIDANTNVIEESEKFTRLTVALEALLNDDVKYNVMQAIDAWHEGPVDETRQIGLPMQPD